MIEQIRIDTEKGLLFLVEDYSYELNSYPGEPFLDLNNEEVRFRNEYDEDGSYDWPGELSKGQQWLKDNIKKEYLTKDTREAIYGKFNPSDFFK